MKSSILVLVLLLNGCVAPHAVRHSSLQEFDPATKTEVWNNAVLYLQEANYPITLMDAPSGTLVTGQVQMPDPRQCSEYASYCREAISLTVSPAGKVIVNINRETYITSFLYPDRPGFWAPVSLPEDVKKVEADQNLILKRVLTLPAK